MRTRLKKHIEVLRLKRLALSDRERAAADAAILTLDRAARQQRAVREHDRFPLRDVQVRLPDEHAELCLNDQSIPDNANRILSMIFGRHAPDDNVIPVTRVPEQPGPDDVAVAPLPGTRTLIEDLAKENPYARLEPPTGVRPYSLSYAAGKAPWWRSGTKQWGRTLNVARLDADDARELRALLFKEMCIGAIRVAPSSAGVRLITPVFVVRSAGGKLRLVHDLRPLNAMLRAATVRYEGVRDAIALRERVATRLDLACAFKHVPMDADASAMMAFRLDDAVFVWNRLPFGASWSPTTFQLALQPVLEALRKEGVRFIAYVDDIYVAAGDAAELDTAVQKVITRLRSTGWRVAPDKVFPWAHSTLTFLGLSIDVEARRVRVPDGKAKKLERLAEAALAKTRMTLAELQKVTGLLSFFLQAVPTVGLAWRGMLGAQVEAGGLPGRHVWVRGALRDELFFWRENAASLPTWPSADLTGEPNRPADLALATDASSDGLGGIWWTNGELVPDIASWTAGKNIPGFTCRVFPLSPDEASESSATRELLALAAAIRDRFGPIPSPTSAQPIATFVPRAARHLPPTTPPPPTRIRWYSDSTAATAALSKWRSGSPTVTATLRLILALCNHHNIVIFPSWVSRDLGWLPAADYLSRVIGRRRQAEWSIPQGTFDRVCAEARVAPTLDAFASSTNAKCAAFRSRYPEKGSSGDAYSATWHRRTWAFPPFSQIPRALEHFSKQGHAGDLLLLAAPPSEIPPASHLALANITLRRVLRLPAGTRLVDAQGQAAPPIDMDIRVFLLSRDPPHRNPT